jgi:hypothetical protein
MGSGAIAPPFLISALDGGGQLHALTVLPPEKEPPGHLLDRRLRGPRANLDTVERRKTVPVKLYFLFKISKSSS